MEATKRETNFLRIFCVICILCNDTAASLLVPLTIQQMYFCLKKKVQSHVSHMEYTPGNICNPDSNQLLYFSRYLYPIDPSESTKGKVFFFSVSTQKTKNHKNTLQQGLLSLLSILNHINRKKIADNMYKQWFSIYLNSVAAETTTKTKTKTEKIIRRSDFRWMCFFFCKFSSLSPCCFHKTCCQFACYLNNGFVLFCFVVLPIHSLSLIIIIIIIYFILSLMHWSGCL